MQRYSQTWYCNRSDQRYHRSRCRATAKLTKRILNRSFEGQKDPTLHTTHREYHEADCRQIDKKKSILTG